MILKNYTNIRHREKRLYSIFDTTISKTGIVLGSLYTALVLLIPFTIGGIIFCIATKNFWYNPIYILDNPRGELAFFMIAVIIPVFTGFFLNSHKIQNYKAIDYIKMLFIPKTPKNSDGTKIKETAYNIDTIVEKIN